MARLEFFFDCSSPWTYLAFTQVQPIIARTKAEIAWRPILVGGVFNAVNQEVYERRANPDPRKHRYYEKDLRDWTRHVGLAIGRPPVFPVRSFKAMRAVIAAEPLGKLLPLAKALFETYWGDLEDISQDDVLTRVFARVGLDPNEMMAEIATDSIKNALRANTDELIARGGFGSPTMFVNGDDMYFGNDRLPLVEAALAGRA
ncbi:MAG: 2-hydroxychromene-2-carboxylate isomerase [Alphaproteobacteria bacterium]|nr:2-hydroxychromene-2-carboxylate isomerase [Alphaproteobacteria bacterium]